MSQEQRDNLIANLIKNYGTVLVFLLGAAITWGVFTNRLSVAENRITTVELKANSIDAVQGDLKGINAKLDIILKKVQL